MWLNKVSCLFTLQPLASRSVTGDDLIFVYNLILFILANRPKLRLLFK